MAAGLLAQIIGCPIDIACGTPMHWKEPMLRIRSRVKPKKETSKRQSRNVTKALEQIRQLQNGEKK